MGAQDVIIKTRAQPFWVFVRLFLVSQWVCSICLAREGEEGYCIRLRVPGGDGEPLTLAMGAS